MMTDVEFRVIDLETGKPRPKGTDDYSEAEYQAWKRLPIWKRWRLTLAPSVLFIIVFTVAAWARHLPN